MDPDNKHYVELWMKQSQLFWQTVYQVPVIAGAMFAGWFALKSASQDLLAQGLLGVGILSMAVQVLILKRMAQYLVTFREAADTLIPAVPDAFAGMSGFILGNVVPVLIAVFFGVLLVWSPSFSAFAQRSTTASSATVNVLGPNSAASLPSSGVVPVAPPQPVPPNPLLKGTSAGKPASAP